MRLGQVVRLKGKVPLELKRQIGCSSHLHRYAKIEDAKTHLERLRARRPHESLTVFVCPVCEGWHVGHDRGSIGEP